MLLKAILPAILCYTCLGQTSVRARLETQLGHHEQIDAVAISPDGKLAATASSGLVTLWELENYRQIHQIDGGWALVSSLAFAEGDSLLVTSYEARGSAWRYRLATGEPIRDPVAALNSCGNGSLILIAEGKDKSAIQETRSRRVLVHLPFPASGGPFACAPAGRTVLLAGRNQSGVWRPELWDLTTGRRLRVLGDGPQNVALAALSPDGQLAAIVDETATLIHLWDTASGRELRQLSGMRDLTEQQRQVAIQKMGREMLDRLPRIGSVVFSPNGKLLGAVGVGPSAVIWEAGTGRQISQLKPAFEGALHYVRSATFSPDSNRILLGDQSGVAQLYEVAMRRATPVMGGISAGFFDKAKSMLELAPPPPPPPPPPVRKEDKPAAPKRISVGGNVQQAKLIRQPKPVYPPLARQARISGVVHLAAVISRDGTVQDVKVISGHPLLTPAALNAAKQWVYQPTTLEGEPVEVQTTIDVNFVLSEASAPASAAAAPTTLPVISAPAAASAAPTTAPAAPPASAPPRMEPVLVANLSGRTAGGLASALSPDGRFLFLTWNPEDPAAGQWDNYIDQLRTQDEAKGLLTWLGMDRTDMPLQYFDLKTGHYGEWTVGPRVFSAAFLQGGKLMVLGHADGSITLWSLDPRKLLRTIPGPKAAVTALLTAGGSALAVHANGELRTVPLLAGEAKSVTPSGGVRVNDAAISSDGRHVLLGRSSQDAWAIDSMHSYLLDVSKMPPVGDVTLADAKGQRLNTVAAHLPTGGAFAFLPDGKSAAISDGVAVSLYETEKGSKIRDLPGSALVRRLSVSEDGKKLVTATINGELSLWDLAAATKLWTLPRHGNGQVLSLRFAEHDRRILAVQTDGTSRFLESSGGQLTATLAQLSSSNWIVTTPDGRFDALDLRNDLPLHWVFSDAPFKPLPVEMFMREYYEPRLLTRVLAGEKLPPVRKVADFNRLLPAVKLTAATPESDMPGTVRIHVEVMETRDPRTGRTSGAQNLRLFRDGQLVAHVPAEDGSISLKDGRASLDLRHVRMDSAAQTRSSSHTLSVYAFNSDGVKTETSGYIYPDLEPVGHSSGREPAPPMALEFETNIAFNPGRRAWLIPIGVNASAVPALNLRYSASDAQLLAAALSQRLEASKQFEKVVTTPLISDAQHPDGAAKETIRKAIASLAGSGPGASGPKDLVVISFSGHGYASSDGRFYLVPSDAGKGLADRTGMLRPDEAARVRLLSESISSDDLARWLRDVDAGRIVLIIDACQSASILGGANFKAGPMGSRSLGQLAYDKGITILAAAQADNVALESGKLGQGLLTYALTHDGLARTAADWQPKDGNIGLHEWLRYGVHRVPELWAAIQAGDFKRPGETRMLVFESASKPQDAVRQEPSIFDFSVSGIDPWIVRAEAPKPQPRR